MSRLTDRIASPGMSAPSRVLYSTFSSQATPNFAQAPESYARHSTPNSTLPTMGALPG